ncbi:hypothetical protein GCM10023208_27440 [Erythrobacter westpacificensis]|uniref:DUF1795 domain-containing protein n=2 Tax=Erythrobacter westpacificensis TaxID=1055231 RepID=A0ABP9KML0_9SPHN
MARFHNMVQLRYALAIAAASLAVASCGDSRPDTGDEAPDTAATQPTAAMQTATLGPFTYEFDQDALTAADIELRIPPTYEESMPVTKLIPEARAQQLGEQACRYGESGEVSECNARQEIGLALALLPRPIDEYRAAFADEDIGSTDLSPVSLDGADGFAFTAEAEGGGTDYRFYSIENRTILLARRFDGSADDAETDEAMDDVMRSLARSFEEQLEEAG